MRFTTLHDAIIYTLEQSNTPLSYNEIADFIAKKQLWKRPSDGHFPAGRQIRDRTKYKAYKLLFNVSPGNEVSLRSRSEKNELRIARMVYNTNNWEYPSGWEGKAKTRSYEKSNGFGHEEWLFNLTMIVDGYHYGFLEPVNKFHSKYEGNYFDVLLYTIDERSKQKYWVGRVNNLEVIDKGTSDEIKQVYIDNGWYQKMVNELDNLNLDSSKLHEWDSVYSLFNVRFRPQNLVRYPPNTKVDDDDASISTNRYNLLHVRHVPTIISNEKCSFVLGQAKKRTRRIATTVVQMQTERLIEYPYIHDQISIYLEKELTKVCEEVFYEHASGNGGLIDIVARKGREIYFYEIKTHNDVRTCIRIALGQLIEYAYLPNQKLASKLFIVTQHTITDTKLLSYFKHLRDVLALPIYYIGFSLESKKITQEL